MAAERPAKRPEAPRPPGWAGLDLDLHDEVYAPAEDTELMLRALDGMGLGSGTRACDVGTGTGVLALAMAGRGARVVAVDRNPHAVRLARANAARNGLAARVGVVRGDLLRGLRGPFDVVAFNPPYVPAPEDESAGDLPKAWAGGAGGIAWAPAFLNGLKRCLAMPKAEGTGVAAGGGEAMVLVSSLGDADGFLALAAEAGFTAQVVDRAKLPWEELRAVRLRPGPAHKG